MDWNDCSLSFLSLNTFYYSYPFLMLFTVMSSFIVSLQFFFASSFLPFFRFAQSQFLTSLSFYVRSMCYKLRYTWFLQFVFNYCILTLYPSVISSLNTIHNIFPKWIFLVFFRSLLTPRSQWVILYYFIHYNFHYNFLLSSV